MIDDEYARNNVIILVSYEELINNIGVIKGIRKLGYKFAVVLINNIHLERKIMEMYMLLIISLLIRKLLMLLK